MPPSHAQTPIQALQTALQQDRLNAVEIALKDCIAVGVSQATLKDLFGSGWSCRPTSLLQISSGSSANHVRSTKAISTYFTIQPEVVVASQNKPAPGGNILPLAPSIATPGPLHLPSPAYQSAALQRDVEESEHNSYERGTPYYRSAVALYEEMERMGEDCRNMDKAFNDAVEMAESLNKLASDIRASEVQIQSHHESMTPAIVQPGVQPRYAETDGEAAGEDNEQYVTLAGTTSRPNGPVWIRSHVPGDGDDDDDGREDLSLSLSGMGGSGLIGERTDASKKAEIDTQAGKPKKKRTYKPRAIKGAKTTKDIETAAANKTGGVSADKEKGSKAPEIEPEKPQPGKRGRGRPRKNKDDATASTTSSADTKKRTAIVSRKSESAEKGLAATGEDDVTNPIGADHHGAGGQDFFTPSAKKFVSWPINPSHEAADANYSLSPAPALANILGVSMSDVSNRAPDLPTPDVTPASTGNTQKRPSEAVDGPQVRGSPASKRQKISEDPALNAMPVPNVTAGTGDTTDIVQEFKTDAKGVRSKYTAKGLSTNAAVAKGDAAFEHGLL